MKKLSKLIFFILSLTFWSCDCLRKVEGTILDAQSNQPISEVKYFNKEKSYSEKVSDKDGKFSYSDIESGSNCPNVILIFTKSGYKSDTISFPPSSKDMIVKLRK